MVYYRSEADSWYLYKAFPDGRNKQKISSDIPCYINVIDGFNIYRIKTAGGELQKLTKLPPDLPDLPSFMPNFTYAVGNYIFYRGYHAEKGDALFNVPLDGSGQVVWDYRG